MRKSTVRVLSGYFLIWGTATAIGFLFSFPSWGVGTRTQVFAWEAFFVSLFILTGIGLAMAASEMKD